MPGTGAAGSPRLPTRGAARTRSAGCDIVSSAFLHGMRDCAVTVAYRNPNFSVADPRPFSIATLERTSKVFLAWFAVERSPSARPGLIPRFFSDGVARL